MKRAEDNGKSRFSYVGLLITAFVDIVKEPIGHLAEMVSLVKAEIFKSEDRKEYDKIIKETPVPESILPYGVSGLFADSSLPDGVGRWEELVFNPRAPLGGIFTGWTPGWQNRARKSYLSKG